MERVCVARSSWSRDGAGVRGQSIVEQRWGGCAWKEKPAGSSVLIERVCVENQRRVAAFE